MTSIVSKMVQVLPIGSTMILMGLNLAVGAENNPGAGHTTRVDKISVKSDGKAVRIQVSAKGSKYDTVDTKNFMAGYSGGVTCRGLYDVHYYEVALSNGNSGGSIFGKNESNIPIGVYTEAPVKWNTDSGKKSVYVSNRTLKGALHPDLKNAALKKCNNEAQKAAAAQNISLAKAMSKTRQVGLSYNWLGSHPRLEAWASCGKPLINAPGQDGGQSWLGVLAAPPKITVECKARSYAPGMVNMVKPAMIGSKFAVTKLLLETDTTKYTGICPKSVKLTATISVNKAGKIEYQWKSGNAASEKKTLVFNKAGQTRKITRSFKFSKTGTRKQRVVVTGPFGSKISNEVEAIVKCKNPV